MKKMIADYIAYIAKKKYPEKAALQQQRSRVYRRKVEPKIYIDITGIKELRAISTEPTLVLGGSVSLTEAMELFYDLSEKTQYAYTKVLADHIDLIANVPVRNAGTIAGNLSIKHQYNEFPSDMLDLLHWSNDRGIRRYSRSRVDRQQMSDEWKIESQTRSGVLWIMPRAQNAHAYVNAGFLMKLSEDGTGKVVQKPNIVFGGIDPQFLHAIDTENFLIGKSVLDEKVLQGALSTLDVELQPDYISPDAVPEYRKGLAKALFYKFILSLAKAKAKKSLISGGDLLTRPLSSAKQTYETDKSVWPLNQPVPKLEALAQCSGEAAYVNDHPAIPGELFGAFVVTTIGRGNISGIDSKEALVKSVTTNVLSEALQMDPDIRLEREITLIRQAEEVRSHQAIVQGSNKEFTPNTPYAKNPHVLRGAGGGTLNISGLCQAERHGHNATMDTFVVDGLHKPLIGPPAIEETFTTSPLKTHKALLSGLFKMIEAYELQHLEEDYPFSVSTPYRGIPGVVRFLTAEDIPGKNCFTPPLVFLFEQEEIFCSGKVLFAGQAVGLIVAETQQVANMAAQKVKIEYTNVKKPVILLREAAKSKDPNIVQLEKELKPKVVKGPEPRHRLRIRRSVVRKKSMLQYKIALATESLSVSPYSLEVAQL
uniref:FAD-binding PCMH-type domain-containing protein n=1 Tax=Timema douglasi TaxID=61478 RepID=A0A7R8Z8W4_TIMDO|nr:unnamed protein product [Timema douglasi]